MIKLVWAVTWYWYMGDTSSMPNYTAGVGSCRLMRSDFVILVICAGDRTNGRLNIVSYIHSTPARLNARLTLPSPIPTSLFQHSRLWKVI